MSHKLKFVCAMFAVVAGLFVFVGTLVHALWYAPEDAPFSLPVLSIALPTLLTPHATSSPVVPASWPVRLQVPSLGIDAHVQSVGIGKSGNMAVPTNYTDVAWYRSGTLPGHVGSAVFDGHVDNGFGLDGVFKHLGDITVGDQIVVITKGGTAYTYTVDATQNYPYDAVPTGTIFHVSDAARLTIITCEGAWISGKKTYDHRLVVYATLR